MSRVLSNTYNTSNVDAMHNVSFRQLIFTLIIDHQKLLSVYTIENSYIDHTFWASNQTLLCWVPDGHAKWTRFPDALLETAQT